MKKYYLVGLVGIGLLLVTMRPVQVQAGQRALINVNELIVSQVSPIENTVPSQKLETSVVTPIVPPTAPDTRILVNSNLAMGIRTEDPGPFLYWPLPSSIGISNITRLPDSPWTHAFLGITDCPPYPASIASNRQYILPGVPDSRVAWHNPNGNFACYGASAEVPFDHEGTDISAANGTTVYAAAGGTVSDVYLGGDNLYIVKIRHSNVNSSGQTWYTIYRHLSAENVSKDTSVARGAPIGAVGAGHLHFELSIHQMSSSSYTRNLWGIDNAPWTGCLWVNTNFCQQVVEVARGIYWNFASSTQGWQPIQNMSFINHNDGGAVYSITGWDPHIQSPVLNLPADSYPHIYIQMAAQAIGGANCGQVFFMRQGDAGYSEERVVYFSPVADGSTSTYPLDMRTSPNWNGIITRLRVDPACNAGSGGNVVRLDRIGLVPSWNFDGNQHSWTVENNIHFLNHSDGGAVYNVTGDDPRLISPPIGVPAALYPYIYVSMASQANSGTNCGQIFFTREGDAGFSEERVRYFTPPNQNGGTFLFDMRTVPNWNGIINRVRLDPACGKNGELGAVRINRFEMLPLLRPDMNIVRNGNFDYQFDQWTTWGEINRTIIPNYGSTGNALGFTRPVNSPNGAAIYQILNYPVPAGSPFEIKLDLANRSSVPKTLSVNIRNLDSWNGAISCSFTLAADMPVQTYIMRGKTPDHWRNLMFEVSANTADGLPDHVMDSISVTYKPSLNISAVECSRVVPENTNLVANADFSNGMTRWIASGDINFTVQQGVAHLYTPTGGPNGWGAIYQYLNVANDANRPYEITVQMQNSSSTVKRMGIHIRNTVTWTGAISCWFDVAPGTLLQPYTVQGRLPSIWNNMMLEITPETDGIPGIVLDNASVQYKPSLVVSNTQCIQPNMLAAPLLTLPADGTSLTNPSVMFQWASVNGAVRYEIQWGRDNPPESGSIRSVNTPYLLSPSLTVGTYYWRVRAVDGSNAVSMWSTTRSFTVTSQAGVAPLRNLYQVSTPELTWNRVTWASGYQVQVDDSLTFINPEFIGISESLFIVTPPLPDGMCYWRVRAADVNGVWGSWSQVDSFTIDTQ